MKKLLSILILVSIPTLIVAAENHININNEKPKEHNQQDTHNMSGMPHDDDHADREQSGDPDNVDRVIQIVAKDIKFTPISLSVRRGETIKFIVTNQGDLLHELVLGTKDYQDKHKAQMDSMSSEEMNHHKQDGKNSVTIQPGQTREIIWTFDSDEEQIEFACHLPGHYEAGMSGSIEINNL